MEKGIPGAVYKPLRLITAFYKQSLHTVLKPYGARRIQTLRAFRRAGPRNARFQPAFRLIFLAFFLCFLHFADSAALLLLMPPLLADSAASLLLMMPLIADSAAFLLLMPRLIADSAASLLLMIYFCLCRFLLQLNLHFCCL